MIQQSCNAYGLHLADSSKAAAQRHSDAVASFGKASSRTFLCQRCMYPDLICCIQRLSCCCFPLYCSSAMHVFC